MAQNDFEMVQATLNSIPKRDKISAEIANDPANIENAENQMTEAEKKMAGGGGGYLVIKSDGSAFYAETEAYPAVIYAG